MTETISLELAKEIADKYELLGENAPKFINWSCGPKKAIPLYTATELFSALPVGTAVEKLINGYQAWNERRLSDGTEYADSLVETLGLMLCRVLDEKIKPDPILDEGQLPTKVEKT